MRFTRVIVTAVVVVIVLFFGALYLIPYLTRAPVDSEKLGAALQRFGQDHLDAGKAFPAQVSLSELIDRRYVSSNDVRGFHGTEITFSLTHDPAKPEAIRIRATLPDGTTIGGFMDGGAQPPIAGTNDGPVSPPR